MPEAVQSAVRYCGRWFSPDELETIHSIIADRQQYPTRAAISRRVCTVLDWRKPDGQLKAMSCRVALLRMQGDGRIALPPPRWAGNPCGVTRFTAASDPQSPFRGPRHDLGPITLQPVETAPEARLWRELIARYHFLGYSPLPGAQLRYLAYAEDRLLAALGFGAAAWKVAPRDRFIGWSAEQRRAGLPLVVNNARFLIAPWVQAANLASTLLAQVARRLPDDWEARYRYKPVLLETFVQRPRHAGTCYRAANWRYLGDTQGRGKLDRQHRRDQPVKAVFVYPLRPDFRHLLCPSPSDPPGSPA